MLENAYLPITALVYLFIYLKLSCKLNYYEHHLLNKMVFSHFYQ
uniref:Uncharacterized protein n=1 Tax=Rhizophora mucronata TaxID=61149 RepID=A0A2P2PEX9_RHIMU